MINLQTYLRLSHKLQSFRTFYNLNVRKMLLGTYQTNNVAPAWYPMKIFFKGEFNFWTILYCYIVISLLISLKHPDTSMFRRVNVITNSIEYVREHQSVERSTPIGCVDAYASSHNCGSNMLWNPIRLRLMRR